MSLRISTEPRSASYVIESVKTLPKLGAISVMVDYFVDRFVRIDSLDELSALMRSKAEQGGGSVRGISQTEVKGGNAVNLAYALGVFGANVNLLAVANSLPAEMLRSIFADLPNVNLQIVEGNAGYTVAFEFKRRRHVNVMISDAGDLGRLDFKKLSRKNLESLNQSEIVAVVNWAANSLGNEFCEKVFTQAKRSGAKTFFDPADVTGLEGRLRILKKSIFDKGLVDYVSLNENEARIMSKALFKHDLPSSCTLADLKVASAILSDGFGSIVDLHTRRHSVSANNREVVSEKCYQVNQKTITGAGDVWAAADLAGYLAKLQDSERLRFANAAAGLYVSRESALPPKLSEVCKFMRQVY
jgi:ribokinase